MTDLSNKKILIYDLGLSIELALKMGEKFGQVLYYVPWADAFPKSEKSLIGDGLLDYNVTRVQSFWDYVDHVDGIYFFDTYCCDIIEYLKDKGYPVFGGGYAEKLETDRPFGRAVQEQAGLPTQNTVTITGLDNLVEYLDDKKNKFIKLNGFRGDLETFHYKDKDSNKLHFNVMRNIMGAKMGEVQFVVEDGIEGIEPGYDGLVSNGQYPDKGIFAYELKGRGYIAKLMNNKEIPTPVLKVNEALSPWFAEYKIKSLYSTEVMVDKNNDGYLIDPTIRAGMPCPTAVEMEIITNFPELLWGALQGNMPAVESKYKYGAGVGLDSEWANEHWLEVEFPESIRQYVKFRRMMKKDNQYYALPGFSSICSVIGLGNTIDDAIAQLKENVAQVKGFELDNDCGGIDKAIEEAKIGDEQYGMNFFK